MQFGNLDPHIMLYVDDTVIYVSAKNLLIACSLLKYGRSKLTRWCSINKLSINVKKTKCLIIDLRNDTMDYPKRHLNGQLLDQVRSYNYLGVSIDDKVEFDTFFTWKIKSIVEYINLAK